jgi:hypothetical protein
VQWVLLRSGIIGTLGGGLGGVIIIGAGLTVIGIGGSFFEISEISLLVSLVNSGSFLSRHIKAISAFGKLPNTNGGDASFACTNFIPLFIP